MKPIKFVTKWWNKLVTIPLKWFRRSSPSLANTPEEYAYRLKHFDESKRANFKILYGQWSQLFDWRHPKTEQRKREASRMFDKMNHPMAGTRQLVDWRRDGPGNPPPVIRKAVKRMRAIPLETRKKAGETLASSNKL